MAFDISKTKKTVASTTRDEEWSEQGYFRLDGDQGSDSTVVATQSWVKRLFSKLLNWQTKFRTQCLQVDNSLEANAVSATAIRADELTLTGGKIKLLDRDGNPMLLYIEDGKLQVEYDFRKVYIYPSLNGDFKVKAFAYLPDQPMVNSFLGVDSALILKRFVDMIDLENKVVNGKLCYRLCDSDNEDELVQKSLLIQCNEVRRIKRIKVLDENLGNPVVLKEFDVPVKRLTINFPKIAGNEDGQDETIIQLPEVCPICNNTHSFQIPMPIQNSFPGQFFPNPMPNPWLFEDEPPEIHSCCNCHSEKSSRGDDANEEQTVQNDQGSDASNSSQGGNEDGQENYIQDIDPNGQDGLLFEDYGADTYTNITLKRSDFAQNQEQYLVFETVDAE